MSKKSFLLEKSKKKQAISYSYNKTIIPFPEPVADKIKPPTSEGAEDNSNLFKKDKEEEISIEEKVRVAMDEYRKAERVVINNFYTGGGAYRKGVLDSIYRGFNPMNP